MSKDAVIDTISPHTIKKFELIASYVQAWVQKLLQNERCTGLVYIDCMSNSGEYRDQDGKQIFGSPIRVAKILRDAAGTYYRKNIDLYFNDFSEAKIKHLQKLLQKVSPEKDNFHIHYSVGDGNKMLLAQHDRLISLGKHALLVYDPYDASINWNAIYPFLNTWGEVILNHVESDTTRALKVVSREESKQKYEQTYLTDLANLQMEGANRDSYEKRVEQIIGKLRKTGKYYIAAFPFFNSRNGLVYHLIHCTGSVEGFKLYKSTAWKTFKGKSSLKDTHGKENQLLLDFENTEMLQTEEDDMCYHVKDIANYLQRHFAGKQVPIEEVWLFLQEHPIFPSEGFRSEIKHILKTYYQARIGRSDISFSPKGHQ